MTLQSQVGAHGQSGTPGRKSLFQKGDIVRTKSRTDTFSADKGRVAKLRMVAQQTMVIVKWSSGRKRSYRPDDLMLYLPPDLPPQGMTANVVECPAGHGLTTFRIPHSRYACDVCDQTGFPVNTRMYSCRKCNWDMCDTCHNMGQVEPDLSDYYQQFQQGQTNNYAEGSDDVWACDKCTFENEPGMDRCGVCESERPDISAYNSLAADSLRGGECVICMDREKTNIFVPCGHQCVCATCADRIVGEGKRCPICRALPTCHMKVFKA